MKKLALIFIILSLSVSSVNAQKITVVTEDWPPYNYKENGEITGVSTEVVKATLEKTDLKWEIRMYPWVRAYKMASEDENTMIYTIFRLPEREKFFKWIKLDGLSTKMYLFSPKSRSDISVKTLEDAKKYRTGVTRKSSTHDFLLSKGFEEGVNLFPVKSEVQNALKADPSIKRIDLTTGDKLSLAMWVKEAGLPSDFWKEEVFLFKQDFYMAFGQKTSDNLVRKVSEAFKQIKADGTFDAIMEKYNKRYQ